MEHATQKGYFIHSGLFRTCLLFEADSYTAKGFLHAILVTLSTNSTCFTMCQQLYVNSSIADRVL